MRKVSLRLRLAHFFTWVEQPKRFLAAFFAFALILTPFMSWVQSRYMRRKFSFVQLQTHSFFFFAVGVGVGLGLLVNRYVIPQIFASDDTEDWTFATAGDYTLSDSSLLEVTSNTARLKVREYSSDANTELLLHLNESSGNPDDSSDNDIAVTASTVTYTSAKLNNGAVFTGAGSQLSVSHADGVSLSGNNTLEGWVNFDTTFTDSSHSERQTIFDKGAYQLYFEHTSGKLVYELEPTTAKSWTQRAGPDLNANNGESVGATWDLNGKTNIYASVKMGSYWFVAIGTATGANDAEVWRCSGCDGSTPTWTKVGGDGVFTSWPMDTYEYAASLGTDGTYLYAGLGGATAGDGDLWRCNGCDGDTPTWTKVGGDAVNSSWPVSTYESVTSIVVSGTTVYVGLGNNAAGDAEVWRCTTCSTSPAWGGARIGGDATNSSWANSTYEEVRSLVIVGTHLVAGLGNTAGDGEVWSTDTTSISWTKRGGDGTASGGQSWGSTYEQVNALGGASNILYVGIGTTPAGEAELWRCDLSATCTATAGWTKIGGDGANSSWNTNYETVRSLLVSGTTMYVGIGDSGSDAEIWRCTSCDGTPTWSQIAGDGNAISPQSWGATHTQVNTMILDGTMLYAGISSSSWSSEFWRCDTGGTCSSTAGWTPLGGSFVNKSWESVGIGAVQELAGGDGKLYAGNGNAQAGNALVWEYDPSTTTWTLIGGQGLNGSWSLNTFESVDSLLYYKGVLFAGLGRSSGDGEVWSWNGTTWTKIGGDTLNSSWANSTYENVSSLVVYRGKLYAGLGNNANGDAEVWRCSGCETGTVSWVKVAGDGINSGWAAGTFREVPAMVQSHDMLFVGLAGGSAGDAEVWRCSSSCDGGSPVWTRVGGDAINSSWANTTYERVDSMAIYDGKVVVGLGSTAGDAEVWQCTGCEGGSPSWGSARIGGDDPSGTSGSTYGWTDGTFEQIFDMVTYNGYLYVGLGITAGESEMWRYDTGTWTKVGGDGLNSSWDATVNYINSMAVHEGKLYSGTGGDANNDAQIWSYGNDSVAKSAALNLTNGSWYHIAATYDGSNMKLYVDGTQSGSSAPTTITVSTNTKPLLIGRSYGSRGNVSAGASFAGKMDELRISSSARDSFITTTYSADAQTIRPSSAVFTSQVQSFDDFTVSETANGGSITYRLSADNGTTWKYYTGGAWTTSASTAQANDADTVDTNIGTFPVGAGGLVWQAILDSDGSQLVTLNSVSVGALTDVVAPSNPTAITAQSSSGGSSITTDTWYTHAAPYFSWTGADDGLGAGIQGYYVYFGTDNSAEPTTAGSMQVGTTYTASSLVSGSTYYLRIKTIDNAQNVSATTWEPFIYKYDSSSPSNPASITVSPAGYAATNSFTFSWPAGTDTASGIAGYQYKTATPSGSLADWSTATTSASVSIDEAAYQTDANTFYLRTVDVAGNVSSAIQALYYFAGEGPSAPQNVAANPLTNTSNSFAFSWDPPDTYLGDEDDLTYCYTINTLPAESTCNYTSAGATSLSADAFATQTGLNIFYVSARNGDEAGGAINYGSYGSVSFTANTTAPGIPQNADIADVSVKTTSSWKLALSWEAPADVGSGVDSYQIYRSLDDTTYSRIATTTGIAYVDTGLLQEEYFYKVKACDNTANCGAFSTAISLIPDGKYTSAPSLSSGPTITGVTTKKATINWSTDRAADSKVQYGTSPGTYFTSEPSSSTHVTDHEIDLSNLSPGTTYYYKAKWTDEDGNTGASTEKSFTTEPAPSVKDVSVSSVGLANAILKFTATGTSKVKIRYGESTAFGGVKTVSTSTSETTYTVELDELEDGTKYYFRIDLLDAEDNEYEGTILDFTTLPRPKISTVRVQQVKNTAKPTILVSWKTNTPTSSIVTYYPVGSPDQAKDEVNVTLQNGEHRMIIRALEAETDYTLIVKGRDKVGNEATSDPQKVTTATDTRPAAISDLKVEGGIQNAGDTDQALAQIVVSWTTDEPATAQVEYGEGTGTTYAQKTQEDSNLTLNHVVVITGLTPSKVYHLRALSKDKASNVTASIDSVTITPKATDNALDLVMSNLRSAFGFLGSF